MMSMSATDMMFKVCVIGDAAVGKSSTVRRWTQGSFTHEYQVTIGVQHYSKSIQLDDSDGRASVKMIVWDLGGQETFKFIRPMFYRAARGIVIMFDLGNRASFDSLAAWIREADTSIGRRVPIIIAGNKADLDQYQVDPGEAQKLAEETGARFVLTSAKSGCNVGDLFYALASLMARDNSSRCEQTRPCVPIQLAH